MKLTLKVYFSLILFLILSFVFLFNPPTISAQCMTVSPNPVTVGTRVQFTFAPGLDYCIQPGCTDCARWDPGLANPLYFCGSPSFLQMDTVGSPGVNCLRIRTTSFRGCPNPQNCSSGPICTTCVTITSPPSPFDYTLTNNGNIAVAQAASGFNTITADLTVAPSQAVSFSASGLPAGATPAFSPTLCEPNPTCSSTLTITTTTSTPLGTYPITVTGSPLSRTTSFNLIVATRPTVITDPATSITATSATLNGTVIADGGSALVSNYFWYAVRPADNNCSSLTSATFTSAPLQPVGIQFSAGIIGLTPNTTYCFRADAGNADLTGFGGWQTFPTLSGLPIVQTNAATAVTPTSATLNGNVSANGGAALTDRGFFYQVMPASNNCTGLANATGTRLTPTAGGGGIGTFAQPIGSAQGVNPGSSAYCYQAYATNSAGTGYGAQLDFGLPGPFASNLTATAGCSGTTPTVNLVWGTSARATSYTILRNSSVIQTGWAGSPYLDNVGLAAGTLYSYQIQAVNSAGSIVSNTVSVTTRNCATPIVDLLANGVQGPISIPSGTSATLTWTSTNATSCNASRIPVSSTWTGGKILNNPPLAGPPPNGESTGTLVLPGPYTFTLTCTNGNNGASFSDFVTINITAPLPWIQTRGGDVHSNIKINTPGGP